MSAGGGGGSGGRNGGGGGGGGSLVPLVYPPSRMSTPTLENKPGPHLRGNQKGVQLIALGAMCMEAGTRPTAAQHNKAQHRQHHEACTRGPAGRLATSQRCA